MATAWHIIKIMSKKTSKKKSNLTASELGKLGGKAVVKKFGKRHMSKLAHRGAEARWGK